jgi:hypothetical protein
MLNIKELISKVEYSEILSKDSSLGWNAYLYDKQSSLVAGGTSKEKETALRIGYSEFIERYLFNQIAKSKEQSEEFLFDYAPTTCGFAAGFDNHPTRDRALLEGIERWAWSKWIDDRIFIPYYPNLNLNTKISSLTLSVFDSYTFFLQKIDCSSISFFNSKQIYFGVLIGFKNGGAFVGSRASDNIHDIIDHSSTEASRAFTIFKNSSSNSIKNNFYYNRLMYFGNSALNLPEFDKFKKSEFPKPKVKLLKKYDFSFEDTFLYRALMDNCIPWHIGDEKRFIY